MVVRMSVVVSAVNVFHSHSKDIHVYALFVHPSTDLFVQAMELHMQANAI